MSGSTGAPRPWALIPAYNEAANVAAVVEEALRHVSTVLVIDDGSTDDTAQVAQSAGATIAVLKPNQGKGAALHLGFRRALEGGAPAVVTLDADGQHDPSEIPVFLAAWRAGAGDLIIGVRQYREMPLSRRLANHAGSVLLRWAIGQPVPDNQSGYRMLTRRALEALPHGRSDFAAEVEQIASAVELGLTIGAVPISTIYAAETSHFHPYRDSRAFLRLVVEIRRRRLRAARAASG